MWGFGNPLVINFQGQKTGLVSRLTVVASHATYFKGMYVLELADINNSIAVPLQTSRGL